MCELQYVHGMFDVESWCMVALGLAQCRAVPEHEKKECVHYAME
jgi:hypothetical protein